MKTKLIVMALAISTSIVSLAQVSVTTQHNDLTRAGWNNKETILTPANVNERQFGKIFRVALDDQIYSQPLVLANVNIAGGLHNVVYAATVNNTVYGIDADNGTVYWFKNYTPPGQRPVYFKDMTTACNGNYKDFSGNIGIVGTPVIDSVTQTIYFVARSTNSISPGSGNFYEYIHAVDIATGNEKANSPVLITASVNGNGDGSVNGILSFNSHTQNQRQGLTLYNGTLFITFSSHCGWDPYHGWILGYDATTLQQKYVYNTTPNGHGGGIWEAGNGMAIDNEGNMYVVVGNGTVGHNNDPSDLTNRGESALKLKADGSSITPIDFFTPNNYPILNDADLDYGSMGAFLIPDTKLYFTGCKDGSLYLVNTDDLGGYDSVTNHVAQTISLAYGATLRSQPSYYRGESKEFVYVWSGHSQLKALPFNRSANNFDKSKLLTGLYGAATGRGAMISTSSNSSKDGTGIVWASYAPYGDADEYLKSGVLRAYDAEDITKELWNSDQNIARDSVGYFAKFSAPTIANGKVYLASFSDVYSAGWLNVYGIIDTTAQLLNCSGNTNLALNQPAFSSSNSDVNHLPAMAFDGKLNTSWNSGSSGIQWIYVDLGAVDSICNITLQWDASPALVFELQVSDDATNWNTVKSINGNNAYFNSLNIGTTGRYVRMYGTVNGAPGGYSLKEMIVYGSLINSCVTPTGLTVNMIDTTSAVIRWNSSNANSYSVLYKHASSTIWTKFNTTADTFLLSGLSCSNYYNYSVKAVCGKNVFSLPTKSGVFNLLNCADCGFLPTRVNTIDIGNIGIGGQACFTAPNTYILKGSGNDIGNTADAFRLAYKDFSGDGRIDVKVTRQDMVNPSNKAGIMFRESTLSNSRYVFIGLTSGNGVVFQYRKNVNDASSTISQQGYTAPYYLRLAKQGTIYTGYISADSVNWVNIASINNSHMSIAPYAGLAVTSHDNTQLSEAEFQGFNIIYEEICGRLPVKVYGVDIGSVGINGNVCYTNANKYTVNGAGSNISGTADSYFYTYKSVTGNATVDVKVTSQDLSNPFNKAGIMLRSSTEAGSKNVFIGLTSANGAVFQYRKGTNNTTTINYSGTYTAPYYLRLVRNNTLYSGYVSTDSLNWLKIGEVNLPGFSKIGGKLLMGLAVTSADVTQLSNVVFDSWTITNSVPHLAPVALPALDKLQKVASAGNKIFYQDSLKVFPNPTKNNFTVEINIPDKQDIVLSIISIGDGRIYYTENLSDFSGNYHREFNQADIPNGSYLISVRTLAGVKTKLLVKER